MVARRSSLPPRRALPGAVVCGVLWFGVYNVALNAAERQIDAGTASLLVNTGPIFIAILAGWAVVGFIIAARGFRWEPQSSRG